MPIGDLVIEPLASHPEVLPTLEQWFRMEWPSYYADGRPGDAKKDLLSYCNRGALPIGVLAFENSNVRGIAVLKPDSIASHKHLSPWAAAGLVQPSERGRGIGAQLLAALEREARALGFDRIYCGTSTAESLLRRNGWLLLERIVHDGETLGIYSKAL